MTILLVPVRRFTGAPTRHSWRASDAQSCNDCRPQPVASQGANSQTTLDAAQHCSVEARRTRAVVALDWSTGGARLGPPSYDPRSQPRHQQSRRWEKLTTTRSRWPTHVRKSSRQIHLQTHHQCRGQTPHDALDGGGRPTTLKPVRQPAAAERRQRGRTRIPPARLQDSANVRSLGTARRMPQPGKESGFVHLST